MSESESGQEARHRQPGLSIELLSSKTDDPEILALWETGLARWGSAFVAFSRLREPVFRSKEVLTAFENIYVTSLESLDALVDDHVDGMGWKAPLDELRNTHFIPDELLDWNRPAVLRVFREFMDVVEEGGQVHVFVK